MWKWPATLKRLCRPSLDLQQKLSLSYILLWNKWQCDLFLEFIALSCSSKVLFVKFPRFLAFFVGLFFGHCIYIFHGRLQGGKTGICSPPWNRVKEPKFSRKHEVSSSISIDWSNSCMTVYLPVRHSYCTAQEPGSRSWCHAVVSLRFTYAPLRAELGSGFFWGWSFKLR